MYPLVGLVQVPRRGPLHGMYYLNFMGYRPWPMVQNHAVTHKTWPMIHEKLSSISHDSWDVSNRVGAEVLAQAVRTFTTLRLAAGFHPDCTPGYHHDDDAAEVESWRDRLGSALVSIGATCTKGCKKCAMEKKSCRALAACARRRARTARPPAQTRRSQRKTRH